MSFNSVPRTHCFSLGDFHDFDRCPFRFFVNHHLSKKYDLAEGNASQAIGSLLDLTIKKVHSAKAYGQPVDYIVNIVKAAETEMKVDVAKRGSNSFYGSQVEYITPEVIEKTKEVFKNYYQGLNGKVKRMVGTPTLKGPKPFWKYQLDSSQPILLWGGADSIELGEDGIPEVVDYKFLEKGDQSIDYLDMDLMPKLYTLLCTDELIKLGYTKVRFMVRLWHDPKNMSFYEGFDLNNMEGIAAYFKDKAERILRTEEVTYCDRGFCKVCQHTDKEKWMDELITNGWIKKEIEPRSLFASSVEPVGSLLYSLGKAKSG